MDRQHPMIEILAQPDLHLSLKISTNIPPIEVSGEVET